MENLERFGLYLDRDHLEELCVGAVSIHASVEASGLLHRETAPGAISAGAGRVWYCIDEHRRIVWLTLVSARHPSQPE